MGSADRGRQNRHSVRTCEKAPVAPRYSRRSSLVSSLAADRLPGYSPAMTRSTPRIAQGINKLLARAAPFVTFEKVAAKKRLKASRRRRILSWSNWGLLPGFPGFSPPVRLAPMMTYRMATHRLGRRGKAAGFRHWPTALLYGPRRSFAGKPADDEPSRRLSQHAAGNEVGIAAVLTAHDRFNDCRDHFLLSIHVKFGHGLGPAPLTLWWLWFIRGQALPRPVDRLWITPRRMALV
jgi:hypothetical protein